MDWTDVSKNWAGFKAQVKSSWDRLTDDDLDEIQGNRQIMLSKLQELYDVDRFKAEDMLEDELGRMKIQGEGNYEASRHFQEAQHEFADKTVKDA